MPNIETAGELTPPNSQELDDGLAGHVQMLREKILFGLGVYPYLSPTMLHTFLGTSTSTHVWKPILNQLIAEGLVVSEEAKLTSPHERQQSYTILHLATNQYTPPKND